MMTKFIVICFTILVVATDLFVVGCLITNCPRGGKRSGKFGISETNVKPCISCGPGHSGQCFGSNICCGPFGCLMGSQYTLRCQREGFFHEREPCIAGSSFCRKNTGRCAMDGICCDQDACFMDKSCSLEEKQRNALSEALVPLDLYNLMGYPSELNIEK